MTLEEWFQTRPSCREVYGAESYTNKNDVYEVNPIGWTWYYYGAPIAQYNYKTGLITLRLIHFSTSTTRRHKIVCKVYNRQYPITSEDKIQL